jgi:hypothetical protein
MLLPRLRGGGGRASSFLPAGLVTLRPGRPIFGVVVMPVVGSSGVRSNVPLSTSVKSSAPPPTRLAFLSSLKMWGREGGLGSTTSLGGKFPKPSDWTKVDREAFLPTRV